LLDHFAREVARPGSFAAHVLSVSCAAYYAAFFLGTLAPFFRASESPMAIACLRLFTVPPFPPLPDFNVPRFLRRRALSTRLLAAFPYLRPPDFREPFFLTGIEILLQFSDEIVYQGWHSTLGSENRTRYDLWRTSVRQRTHRPASAPTNVRQHFVVGCHPTLINFSISFGVFFM
jgi:hypothetical protein